MKIIAHRGFWLDQAEKNSMIAFKRALDHGFGIETDFRDLNGTLVISHDCPVSGVTTADEFAEIIQRYSTTAPHALNIKSDGLHVLLKHFIFRSELLPTGYFVFDMSVPDMRGYLEGGISCYTRISEYEQVPVFLHECDGIWLDAFKSDWYDFQMISKLLRLGKPVAIVSPELHKRPHLTLWKELRQLSLHTNHLISLCTDFPGAAKDYFGG